MRYRMLSVCLTTVFVALLGTTARTHATVIAYDEFSYSTGELDGQNGGSGWAGAWSANTSYSDVMNSPTVTYSYGDKTLGGGNNARIGNGPNVKVAASRQLQSKFGVAQGEDSIYIGVLVNFQGTLDTKDNLTIWLDDNNAYALHGSAPTVGLNVNGDAAAHDFVAYTTSTHPKLAGQTNASENHYLVAHFYKSTQGGAFDSMEFWVDPVAGDQANPDTTYTGDTDATLTGFQYVGITLGSYFDSGDWLHIDHLILGTSFNDVVPVPEPSTLALCGLGIAGLIVSQRKKSAKDS